MPKKKTNVNYSFRVRGAFPPVILEEVPDLHRARADEKDCIAFGWSGKKGQDLLLGCRRCGEPLLRRARVVTHNKIDCRSCIQKPYEKAGEQFGAVVIGKDPQGTSRHDQLLRLSCGHMKRLQKSQIQKVAQGINKVDCIPCRYARYDREAKIHGWAFLHVVEGRQGYARYQHKCGTKHEFLIGNMKKGQCRCAQCGDQVRPGLPGIYIFQIDLPDHPVVKLGFSKRHTHRLRRDLRIAKDVTTKVLRFLPMPSRQLAQAEEKAAHSSLRAERPEWIVPKSIFGDAIFVKSEIYRPEALPSMHRLLDEISARHRLTGMSPDLSP